MVRLMVHTKEQCRSIPIVGTMVKEPIFDLLGLPPVSESFASDREASLSVNLE